jgi:hypothetical protein
VTHDPINFRSVPPPNANLDPTLKRQASSLVRTLSRFLPTSPCDAAALAQHCSGTAPETVNVTGPNGLNRAARSYGTHAFRGWREAAGICSRTAPRGTVGCARSYTGRDTRVPVLSNLKFYWQTNGWKWIGLCLHASDLS